MLWKHVYSDVPVMSPTFYTFLKGVNFEKLIFFSILFLFNLISDEKIKLGRVILPYHASEQGELSLHIDQLVDVIKEFKSTGWGFGKISGTKEKGKFPLNFIEILGDKESDFAAEELMENGLKIGYFI